MSVVNLENLPPPNFQFKDATLHVKSGLSIELSLNKDIVNLHRDIIDRCIAGSESAKYELYKLYSKAMFNVCLRIVNDREEAEDVLQEAFVSAFSNLRSYRGEASFGSWLKRIVVNKCINTVKRRQAFMVSLDDAGQDVVESSDLTEGGQMRLEVDRIKKGIAELPDGFRSVLSLYLLEGYDHKEVGEIMGISESTSKSQYMRAKKKLRSILENRVNYG